MLREVLDENADTVRLRCELVHVHRAASAARKQTTTLEHCNHPRQSHKALFAV